MDPRQVKLSENRRVRFKRFFSRESILERVSGQAIWLTSALRENAVNSTTICAKPLVRAGDPSVQVNRMLPTERMQLAYV